MPQLSASRLVAALQGLGAVEIFACAGETGARVFARWAQASPEVPAGDPLPEGAARCGGIPFVGEPGAAWDLFEPSIGFLCADGRLQVLVDADGAAGDVRRAWSAQAPLSAPPASASALDGDAPSEADRACFERAVAWARAAPGRRLTVARRVAVTPPDPLATFAQMAPRRHERALLRLGSRRWLGCSPELLARGSRRGFSCYKLSGTAPLGADMADDPRLTREHAGSVYAVLEALERLGAVRRGRRQVVELAALQHFETGVGCTPRPGTSAWDCVSATRPTGASPSREGLAVLASAEPPPRGLYYGLAGYALPDGGFSFSQLIRALFQAPDGGWFAVAGAAATAASTPALELAEARLKLGAIRYVPAAPAPEGL